MLTNADVTLYLYRRNDRKESYQRLFVQEVFWDEVKQANVSKTGQRDADSVLLVIPLESLEREVKFTPGKDLVVKGECELEVDSTDQKTISESMQILRSERSFCTVMAADEKLFGGGPHYELSCR